MAPGPGLGPGAAGASCGVARISEAEEVVEEDGVGEEAPDMEARSAEVSASFSKAAAGDSQAARGQGLGAGAGRWAQVGSRLAQRFAMGGRSCFLLAWLLGLGGVWLRRRWGEAEREAGGVGIYRPRGCGMEQKWWAHLAVYSLYLFLDSLHEIFLV